MAYSVVWTPIPCISRFLSLIGHVGVSAGQGLIHDYSGSYFINVDPEKTLFGPPTHIWNLDLSPAQKAQWDEAVRQADLVFSGRRYDFFKNNCHHYVAYILNLVEYQDNNHWNPWRVSWHRFRNARPIQNFGKT